jgi:excisionase family DNA binding protein
VRVEITDKAQQTEPSDMMALLTEEQIAQKIGVTPRCIRDWRNRRIIPFLKIGRIVRFNEGDVAKALSQYKREAAQVSNTINHN